jgi:hypothetical protein
LFVFAPICKFATEKESVTFFAQFLQDLLVYCSKLFESVVVVVIQVIGFFKRFYFFESIDIHGMNWILNPFHCQLLKLHYMSGDNMSSGGGSGFVA